MKSFLGRHNSLKPPVFGFCGSLLYDLEESIEVRALISWVFWFIGIQKCKKFLPKLFVFLSCHYGFTNYFDILIFLISNIPGGVPSC